MFHGLLVLAELASGGVWRYTPPLREDEVEPLDPMNVERGAHPVALALEVPTERGAHGGLDPGATTAGGGFKKLLHGRPFRAREDVHKYSLLGARHAGFRLEAGREEVGATK